MENSIFTVSPSGPYYTIADAQNDARKCTGTVLVRSGIYREQITLDERDSGCTYRAEPGTVLTGGISFTASDAAAPAPEMAERFPSDAAGHVRVMDLTEFGLTAADWGNVYPIGAYHTASRYDDAQTGINLEVFENDRRMTLARYPNEGYLKLDGVLDMGEVNEFPPQNYWQCNYHLRNPRGGMLSSSFGLDQRNSLRMRIKNGLLYTCYGFFAGLSPVQMAKQCPNPGVMWLCLPFGWALYRYWKHKHQKP